MTDTKDVFKFHRNELICLLFLIKNLIKIMNAYCLITR
jgi:hypothetical protein